MIFVLTGNGKGKTTGAIGMGIRATGAGRRVLMVQFLKTGGSSEEKTAASIKNFKIRSFGRPCFVLPEKELKKLQQRHGARGAKFLQKIAQLINSDDFKLAKEGWVLAKNAIIQGQCDFLILDEINLALKYKLLDQKAVLDFLKRYGKKFDIVLTGRYCPKEVIGVADLISEIREVKHPYQKGERAKRGIDY